MLKRVILFWTLLVIVLTASLATYLALSSPRRPTDPQPASTAIPAHEQLPSPLASSAAQGQEQPSATPSPPPGSPVSASHQDNATSSDASNVGLSAQDLLDKGRRQQTIGDDAAVATFQALLDRYPTSPLADEARLRLGQSLIDAHRESDALAVLLPLADGEPQSPLTWSALLIAAGIQRRQGRLTEAIGLYQRYLALDSSLAGYIQREIATLQADLNQPMAAIASYKAALTADMPPDYAQSIRRRIAALATGSKDYQQAIEWWTRVDEAARSTSDRALAVYSIGLIQKESGATAEATSSFQRLVQTYPETWYALQALEILLKDGMDVPLLQQGAVYFANRSNEKALAVYQRYLASNPNSSESGLIRYRMAILQQRLGNLEQAIAAFDEVHRLYPNDDFARSAWLEVARTLARLGRQAEAAAFYEQVAAWYPQSAEAEQALWEGAMIHYRLGRGADAARLLERLRQTFPSSRTLSRTILWEGKSLLANGDKEGAQKVLQSIAGDKRVDYYVLRAHQVLSQTAGASPVWITTTPGRPDLSAEVNQKEQADFLAWMQTWAGSPVQPDIRSNVHLQRAIRLLQARFYSEAATEFSLARGDIARDAWALLAYIDYMRELGLPYQVMAAANRLLALSSTTLLDAPRYLQRLLYPIEYADLLQSLASEYGVDILWMAAMIRQESGFDRYALSSAEARGLTQVIPPTASEIAARLGFKDFKQEDLFKPMVSLRFGAWYMSQGLKITNGNVAMALAGYNGGLGNAQRWAANQQQLDNDLFVEDIGFSETQLYVKLVYEHYYMYSLIWGAH